MQFFFLNFNPKKLVVKLINFEFTVHIRTFAALADWLAAGCLLPSSLQLQRCQMRTFLITKLKMAMLALGVIFKMAADSLTAST